jgi:hypothetical protein
MLNHAHRGRAELLEHPEALHVRVGVGRDDRHRLELLSEISSPFRPTSAGSAIAAV